MDELRTSTNRIFVNDNGTNETSSIDDAKTPMELFQSVFPAAYDTIKFLFDTGEMIISALDAALPWCDVYTFVRLFSGLLCTCFIANYSYFMLALVVVIRKVAFKEKDPAVAAITEGNIQERLPSDTMVSSLNEGGLHSEGAYLSSESQRTKADESPKRKFVIECALDFGMALIMNYPSYMFSATVIFVIACLPDFKEMGGLIKEGMTNAPKFAIGTIGVKLLLLKDAPEPALVAFLNKNIQSFWSSIEDEYNNFVIQNLPDTLKMNCHLIIYKQSFGVKMPPTVLSAKIKELEKGKIRLGVNLFCNEDFAGRVKWNTGEEFKFENVQIDVKLQLELTYVRMMPEETVMLSDVEFHLKKINKLDFLLKQPTLPMESIKPVKKLFINAAKDAIQSYFPCHLQVLNYTTPNEIAEPSRQESQMAPNSTGNQRMIQKILNEFTSSSQQIPDPPVSSFSQENSVNRSTIANRETNQKNGEVARSPFRRFSSVSSTDDTILSTESKRDNFPSAISFARNMILQASDESIKTNTDINSSGNGIMENANDVSASTSSIFGQIELSTAYQPLNELIVTVHKLRDLPMYKGKPPNPYVKLMLQCKHERWTKGTTNAVEGSNNPEIEMFFTFKLQKPLSEYTLKVTVKSKHKHNHTLGEVFLSFTPSLLRVKERTWYDLSEPKKEQIKIPVYYRVTF